MKKIILIGFILIVLVSIAAVNAEENQTQDLIDLNASISIPEEMPQSMTLNNNFYNIKIDAPEDYNETINIYVDESLVIQEPIKTKNYGIYPFEYDVGNHTLLVNFPQTSIYKELNLTKKFSIVETQININAHSDYIYVSSVTASDATGYLSIYVNNTRVKNINLNNIDGASGYSTQLHNYNPGKYNVTVVYSGDSKYKKAVKSKIVTLQYSMYISDNDFDYYGDTNLGVQLPANIKNKRINVLIDGNKYPAVYNSEEEYFSVNLSGLSIGKHPITITYNGDSIYPKQSINDTITIYSNIKYESTKTIGENSSVSLRLPGSERGNLTLYVSKEKINTSNKDCLYGISPLINGVANITISGLNTVGRYHIFAYYTGPTYVNSINASINVIPKIILPPEVQYGQKTTIYATGNANATGKIEGLMTDGDLEEKEFEFDFVNGSGEYTFEKLPIGKIHFLLDYYDNSNSYLGRSSLHINVKSLTPILSQNKDINMYYNDGSVFSVKVKDEFGKYTSGKLVKFKIGSKTYPIYTDSKGIAKLKITEIPGKYKIISTYKGVSVTNKIVVKKILTLNSVKVKKSAKKLVLTATLKNKKAIKNKQVTFKFNGKTYKTKTNSKGIAKVTIKSSVLKKLKVGKKVTYQATYLKDTVKKTVKVQR